MLTVPSCHRQMVQHLLEYEEQCVLDNVDHMEMGVAVDMMEHILLMVVHITNSPMKFNWFTALSIKQLNGSLLVLFGGILHVEHHQHLKMSHCFHFL